MVQVRRRKFLIAAGAFLAAPLAGAQTPRHARVGVLVTLPRKNSMYPGLLPKAFREQGWVEGRNLLLEWRFADGQPERLNELAAELVRLGVDVIVAPATAEALAARHATRSIPIITMIALDPVKAGLAQGLARPGGNVTGVLWGAQTVAAKLTDIVKQTVPSVRRIGVLYVPDPVTESYADANEAGAHALGVGFHRFRVLRPEHLDAALAAVKREHIDALYVVPGGAIAAAETRILEFAVSNRLPTVYPVPSSVERGGLMSYSPNVSESTSRAAALADRILKGAKPGDLPFEYPTRYDLVLNFKTAKLLGLTISQSILVRADRVIE